MFDEIHLLREWIGAVPMEVPLYPLWGALARVVRHLGGDFLGNLSIASFVFYLLNAALLFWIARNFFRRFVVAAEESAAFAEAEYDGLENLTGFLLSFIYLMTPAFARAAFQPSPLTMSQFFPIVALFGLSMLVLSDRMADYVVWVFLAGFSAGLSFFCGAIGALPLPLVVAALVLEDVRKGIRIIPTLGLALVGASLAVLLTSFFLLPSPVSDFIRLLGLLVFSLKSAPTYPGAVSFALAGVLPFLIGGFLLYRGLVRPMILRMTFFVGWGLATLALCVFTVVTTYLGEKNPMISFVDGILSALGDRDVIVSDGAFDDLISFRLPKGVTLLTLGHEREIPRNLLEAVTDSDLKFAADLGATVFVEEWFRRDVNASRRSLVICAKDFQTPPQATLVPEGWCWRGAIGELTGETVLRLLATWNERWELVGSRIADDNAPCWYMRRLFAVQGQKLVKLLKQFGHDRKAQVLQETIGRIDSAFSVEAEHRRKLDRETIESYVGKLAELDGMDENNRAVRIVELEDRIIPELAQRLGEESAWLLHVYRGEVAIRKGRDYRRFARDEYRVATLDERSDLEATAAKLLLLDASLKDDEGTFADARGILRRDRSNQVALAIVGNYLAGRGENAKAEIYLRRAIAQPGPVPVEPLNDLAEVVARQDRLEEALELSDRVVAHAPEIWTFQETRAAILTRLLRFDEAETALTEASRLAKEVGQGDVARNILDIDRARLLKLKGVDTYESRLFIRNIKTRELSPAHRALVEKL